MKKTIFVSCRSPWPPTLDTRHNIFQFYFFWFPFLARPDWDGWPLNHFHQRLCIRQFLFTEIASQTCSKWSNWNTSITHLSPSGLFNKPKMEVWRKLESKQFVAHIMQGTHPVKNAKEIRGRTLWRASRVTLAELPRAVTIARGKVLYQHRLSSRTLLLAASKLSWMNTMILTMLVSELQKAQKGLLNTTQVTDLRNGPTFGIPRNNMGSNCATFWRSAYLAIKHSIFFFYTIVQKAR